MSTGKSFTRRSLAGALISALLFASPVEASRFSNSPSIAGNTKLALSVSKNVELRPASSDTFEPRVAGSASPAKTVNPAHANDPFELRLNPDAEPIAKVNHHLSASEQIEHLSQSIKRSHIFPTSVRFKLMRHDGTIALSTYRHPFGKEVDMKIDSLLVAREVLKSGIRGVQNLKVYFFAETEQNEYTLASVDLDLVRHFDAGHVSNNEVFEAMRLKHESLGMNLSQMSTQTYDEIASTVRPVGGILQQERIDLFHHIDTLQTRGLNVNGLKTAYLLLEDAIRQNDDLGARAAYAFATELLENARVKAGISSIK